MSKLAKIGQELRKTHYNLGNFGKNINKNNRHEL